MESCCKQKQEKNEEKEIRLVQRLFSTGFKGTTNDPCTNVVCCSQSTMALEIVMVDQRNNREEETINAGSVNEWKQEVEKEIGDKQETSEKGEKKESTGKQRDKYEGKERMDGERKNQKERYHMIEWEREREGERKQCKGREKERDCVKRAFHIFHFLWNNFCNFFLFCLIFLPVYIPITFKN